MDKKKIILLVSVIAVVAILAFSFVKEGHNEYDLAGEWYEIHSETITFDSDNPADSKIEENIHSLSDKAYPFQILWVEDQMFSGIMNGLPVVGTVVADEINFEFIDTSSNIFAHIEGSFDDNALVLSVIAYSNSDMNEVIGGAYLRYAHSLSKEEPSFPVIPSFESLNVENGEREYYHFDEKLLLINESDVNSFDFIKTGGNIALVKTTISDPIVPEEETLYSIIVNKDYDRYGVDLIISGTLNKVVYAGWVHLADNQLQTIIYPRGDSNLNCILTTYAADYKRGVSPTPVSMEGYWDCDLSYSYGTEIFNSKDEAYKHFTSNGHCFASNGSDNEGEYMWIGTCYGPKVYLVAEIHGTYHMISGFVEGDKAILSGHLYDQNGKQMAATYHLNLLPSILMDKTGNWYLVCNETVSLDDPDSFKHKDYEINEMKNPLKITSAEEGLFVGNLDGTDIKGGLIGEYLSFECKDEKKGFYYYCEGNFDRTSLILSIIYYEDETMQKVVGGSFARYMHEVALEDGVVPACSSAYNLQKLKVYDSDGNFYSYDSNHDLVEQSYGAEGLEFISQGAYVSILKSNIRQSSTDIDHTIYSVCVFKESAQGMLNYLVAGSNSGKVYAGSLSLTNGQLILNYHVRGGDRLAYSSCVYDVSFHNGLPMEFTDVSGTWAGEYHYTIGSEEHSGKVVKTITTVGSCIGSYEVTEEGDTFVWLGSSYSNLLFIMAEHEGRYFYLFGYMVEDSIFLAGCYLNPDGVPIPISYSLVRQD